MRTCYIVGAGDFDTPFSPEESDFVIAADGGLSHLLTYGIRCDLAIGDFDSLGELPSGCEYIKFPVEKDFTDTALALFEGKERGYTKFVILGGTGGRYDHTFANYSLLLKARELGCQAKLVSKSATALVIKNEEIQIKCDTGCHLSVFAFGGEAKGVSISGLKYEVSDITLSVSSALAACNLFDGRVAKIRVTDGTLLLIAESGDAKIYE